MGLVNKDVDKRFGRVNGLIKRKKKNQSYHVNKNLEIITGRGNILEFVVMQQWMLKSARSTSLVWRLGSWARTLLGWPARRDSFRLCSHHIWFYNKALFLLKVYSCTVTGAVVDAVEQVSFLQDPSNISSGVWLESLAMGVNLNDLSPTRYGRLHKSTSSNGPGPQNIKTPFKILNDL